MCALFLLTSCSNRCSEWQFESITSSAPCYQTAKLYTEPNNIFRDVGVEVAYSSLTGCRLYLNLYGRPVKPQDSKSVEVTIIIDDDSETIMAYVYEGNQRILLPEEMNDKLLTGLLNNDSVIIRIGSYNSEVPLDGFRKNYYKLLKQSQNLG